LNTVETARRRNLDYIDAAARFPEDEAWTTIRGVVIVAIVAGTRVGRANK